MIGPLTVLMMAMMFAPIVKLHPDETAFPTNLESMLTHSQMINENTWQVVQPFNSLTLSNVNNLSDSCHPHCCLHSNSSHWRGISPHKLNDSAPYYVNYYEHNDKWYLQYVFLYMYNPGYQKSIHHLQAIFGNHEADAEHITIEFKESLITRVYFAAHGVHDGVWKNRDEIHFHDSHPIVYSALGSHASYPSSGTWFRCWFLTNDVCNGTGYSWKPKRLVLVDDQEWTKYTGNLGANIYTRECHVKSFVYQRWWGHETNHTTNMWDRVLKCE